MADLDTQNKRASAIMLDLQYGRAWPNPDGSLANAGEREHMAYKYQLVGAVRRRVGFGAGFAMRM